MHVTLQWGMQNVVVTTKAKAARLQAGFSLASRRGWERDNCRNQAIALIDHWSLSVKAIFRQLTGPRRKLGPLSKNPGVSAPGFVERVTGFSEGVGPYRGAITSWTIIANFSGAQIGRAARAIAAGGHIKQRRRVSIGIRSIDRARSVTC